MSDSDNTNTLVSESQTRELPPVSIAAHAAVAGGTGPVYDPFALENLRLGHDFASSVGVKKVITTVPCRKPSRHEFVRVHPSEEYRLETAILEDQVNREIYLVSGSLRSELAAEVAPVCLFTTITRQGDVFLWPAKLPRDDGRANPWNESALAAVRIAETRWVRVAANMNAGYYDTYEAAGLLSDPEWPDLSFDELLRRCFRDRMLTDLNHPILRALRGEV